MIEYLSYLFVYTFLTPIRNYHRYLIIELQYTTPSHVLLIIICNKYKFIICLEKHENYILQMLY